MNVRQELIDIYDDYTHVHLDRRALIKRLVAVVGSAAAAALVLKTLEADGAKAAIVAPEDRRITVERRSFEVPGGAVSGYLARPADAPGRRPGIVVLHENRGLNPHIEDVARRAALAGFVGFAPDFLSPVGGTPEDQDQARRMIRGLDRGRTVEHAVAAVAYLKAQDTVNGKVGAVGFCWGGWLANQVAVHASRVDAPGVDAPGVDAVVAFYGRQPKGAEVARIGAPLLLHYAGLDSRVNAGIEAYRSALAANGADFTIHLYEGANHAFHNDTAAARYDKAAAELAWSRTIAFFRRHLGA